MQTCGLKCTKCLLFVFNIIFALIGLTCFIFGVYFLATYGTGPKTDHFILEFLACAIIGGVMFIVAFFGAYGALMESYCCLMTFVIFLSLILIAQIVVAIFTIILVTSINDDSFYPTLKTYYESNVSKLIWDSLQSELKCCGVKGPSDWAHAIPASCCTDSSDTPDTISDYCTKLGSKKYLFSIGCKDAFMNWFKDITTVFITIDACCAIINIIGIIFGACMISGLSLQLED